MIQPKIHKRSNTRFIQLILNSLQHILVLLAFVMFFSYIQVATAQTISIQPDTIEPKRIELAVMGGSYLTLLIGTFSLVLALVVKRISQKFLPSIGYQAKEYLQ